MDGMPTDDEIREMAKARVGFRMHAVVYVAVNLLLVLIWWLTSGRGPATLGEGGDSYYWPIWPHLGWGLGLALHGFGVYGGGQDWQRREEEKLRAKYRSR
jgi:hypothetical protein